MNNRIIVISTALFVTAPISFAGIVGPSMYACFDATQTTGVGQAFTGTCTDESPFAADLRGGNFGYFEFEDWEALAINMVVNPIPTNATGVTITHAGFGGSQNTGSVDQDNGAIDNVGGTFGAFGNSIEIIFDAGALGQFPTHVGFVATGSGQIGIRDIRVEIFGPDDVLLGTINNQICPISNCVTVSEDDLFYGWTDVAGIAKIAVSDPNVASNIIMFDHLQYGAIVPVPAAAWLFGSALGMLAWLRRRRVD